MIEVRWQCRLQGMPLSDILLFGRMKRGENPNMACLILPHFKATTRAAERLFVVNLAGKREHASVLRTVLRSASNAEALISRKVFLRASFKSVISWLYNIAWPPRSPDLSILDLFLWAYLKEWVYRTRLWILQELQDAIRLKVVRFGWGPPAMYV